MSTDRLDGSYARRVASANPAKLMTASQAADWLDTSQRTNMPRLAEEIVQFNGFEGVTPVNLELHAGEFSSVVTQGDEIDEHLARVAAAFLDIGIPITIHPTIGPLPSGMADVLYTADDAAVSTAVDQWELQDGMQFREGDSGREVRGPDGNWYRLMDAPPPNAPPLDRTQETVDLGNPQFGLTFSAAVLLGLTRGDSPGVGLKSMPPGAYENIHFDENGYIVIGPEVSGLTPPPTHAPSPGDADPSGGGWGMIQGGLAAAVEHAHTRHNGVHHMQATYYMDPDTGERVAVVDVAKMVTGSNDIIIREGRLSFDEHGRPEIVPRPAPSGHHAPQWHPPIYSDWHQRESWYPHRPPPGEDWAPGYPGDGPPPPRSIPRDPPPEIPPAERELTEHRIPIGGDD